MNESEESIKKKGNRKKKIKTEKVWTQTQLKKLWSEAWGIKVILRQPWNEICVFESLEYLGTRRVKFNTQGGAYDAHYWRVRWLTQKSVLREVPNEGVLEIPCSKWNKNKEKGNIQKEPEEVTGIHTVTVDPDGRIFRLEEGNTLE
jgi:hypothetical protein